MYYKAIARSELSVHRLIFHRRPSSVILACLHYSYYSGSDLIFCIEIEIACIRGLFEDIRRFLRLGPFCP